MGHSQQKLCSALLSPASCQEPELVANPVSVCLVGKYNFGRGGTPGVTDLLF